MSTHLEFKKWGFKGMSNCLEETGIISKKKTTHNHARSFNFSKSYKKH